MYLEIFQTASAENGLGVTLTGICDTFSSLIWDVEYFSPGKFEVYVSANAGTIALFRRGNIVGRSDDKQHYGIIEGVYLRTDAENGDYLTISGRFLMCLLSRRIITPTLSFTAYRTYGEIVQTAVQKNCITPWTAAERGIPSLKIGAVSGDCWEIKNVLQVSYENLMDWIYTVCRNIGGTANIRLREVDTGKYAMFLELSQGTDRSIMQRENMPVVFSDAYDNLLTYIYNSDYSEYRNYAYISAKEKESGGSPLPAIPERKRRRGCHAMRSMSMQATCRRRSGTTTAAKLWFPIRSIKRCCGNAAQRI